jgi:hypothetical protein
MSAGELQKRLLDLCELRGYLGGLLVDLQQTMERLSEVNRQLLALTDELQSALEDSSEQAPKSRRKKRPPDTASSDHSR